MVSSVLCTDEAVTFESKSAMELVGFGMTQRCADIAFQQAGFKFNEGRNEVGVIELHDCFAANEVIKRYAINFC